MSGLGSAKRKPETKLTTYGWVDPWLCPAAGAFQVLFGVVFAALKSNSVDQHSVHNGRWPSWEIKDGEK